MKQIAHRQECDAEDSTRQIDIMSGAVRVAPMHPGQQAKRFQDVDEHDNRQTPCTK